MKAFRRHKQNGERFDGEKWVIEKNKIKEYEVSPALFKVLQDNPNTPVHMSSYCDKEFRDTNPDVFYFGK